jgi:hypothetical protein
MKWKTVSSLNMNLILLALVLTACQPEITRTREVADAASPLLGGLIQETDLTGEWRWIRESTLQQTETPAPQNQQLLESAMRILRGDFGVEQHYFTIVHGLERYQQNPPHPQTAEFEIAMGFTSTLTLPLNLASQGKSLAAKCWRSSDPEGETVCNVVTAYPHLLSNIVVYAPATMDEDTLRVVLDQVLNQTDRRIKTILP